MSNKSRWVAAFGFAVAWCVVTYVREWFFEPNSFAWWALLVVALACGFAAGWSVAHRPDSSPVR